MALVHVEIPLESGPILQFEEADFPAALADEADLGIAFGEVPGLADSLIVVLTTDLTGLVAHVERPAAGGVLLEVPESANLTVTDELDLQIVPDFPGAVLVLVKTA